MKFSLQFTAACITVAMLFASCSDDDDNNGNGDSTAPPTTAHFATFELDGAIVDTRSGISIATNDITNNGSLLTFEHLKPITEPGAAWRLTFLYNAGDTLQMEPGVYSIGSQSAMENGSVDFTALYLDELDGEAATWTTFDGQVSGSFTVLEWVGDEFINGSFELIFTNDNLGNLTISNGEFSARYFENYF